MYEPIAGLTRVKQLAEAVLDFCRSGESRLDLSGELFARLEKAVPTLELACAHASCGIDALEHSELWRDYHEFADELESVVEQDWVALAADEVDAAESGAGVSLAWRPLRLKLEIAIAKVRLPERFQIITTPFEAGQKLVELARDFLALCQEVRQEYLKIAGYVKASGRPPSYRLFLQELDAAQRNLQAFDEVLIQAPGLPVAACAHALYGEAYAAVREETSQEEITALWSRYKGIFNENA